MTTSIVMCTYNGAKFIEKQMRSLLQQTVQPDEIWVCDDGSTDNTLDIVRTLQHASAVPIHIIRNTERLGIAANFVHGMQQAVGDIIFCCDQDDIWRPHKIATIVHYFEQHPNKKVVFTNASLIDTEDKPTPSGKTLFDVNFLPDGPAVFDRGMALEQFSYVNRAAGMSMACRREMVAPLANCLSDKTTMYHDELLAFCAIFDHALGYILEPLTRYRQQSGLTGGVEECLPPPRQAYSHDFVYPQRMEALYANFPNAPEWVLRRWKMAKWRALSEYWLLGSIKILFSAYRYRRCYGNNAWYFMRYDLQVNVRHTLHRIVALLKRICHIQ